MFKYRLACIIYFGEAHFTARIIKADGQVWYYDGMKNSGNPVYNRTTTNLSAVDMLTAHDRSASSAIYTLEE
ncbi:hypothetical protein CPB84DRAFT_1692873 [Gymnopilus junonius]|uniref:Uncharacterized protein n=1 Tax=Gymnopilus junonius TaxID=109634 RepID=A0A9P5N9V1_GYMJU|nr:hypothetical protein CPB84DRAFT_1692873 [Gymnopilus junonius]